MSDRTTATAPSPNPTTKTTATFSHGGKELSLSEYRKAIITSMKKSGGLGQMCPEALVGFTLDAPIDFKEYDRLAYPHPKDPVYYDKKNADPKFLEIYEGIERAQAIDDPIVIYPHENGEMLPMVIDGATRLTAIAYQKAEHPDWYKRIPVILFKGSMKEAKEAMVKRNLDGRGRNLTGYEIMKAVGRLAKLGYKDPEICTALGRNPKTWASQCAGYRKADAKLIKPLKEAFRRGQIVANTAHHSAGKFTVEEQNGIAKQIKKQEDAGLKVKITGSHLLAQKTGEGKTEMNFIKRLTTMQKMITEQIAGGLRKKKFFKSEVVKEDLNALETAYVHLIASIGDALPKPDPKPEPKKTKAGKKAAKKAKK